jgi:acyl-CoA reductase-like NAD-dependent aldehyde dehydrogenase
VATETPTPAPAAGHPSGEPIVRDKLYIGGQWVDPDGTGTIDVVDATTEEVIGRIPEGTPADIERAAGAARAAFADWSRTPTAERAALCQAVAAQLAARGEEIAELIARELGMPVGLSRMIQAGLPTMTFGSMPQVMEEIAWQEQVGNSLIVREPVGVVGAITPWNYPLHQICAKVAPALAAGCTVVVKPSEVTPLSAFVLAEILDEAGLPAGVFNLVTGFGPVVGEALASSPEVDMISFTGSTRAGKRVAEIASQSVKRVALELGGKSANIVLEDADLQQAVTDGISKCFLNSGQTCSALTRMLVPRERLPEAEAIAAAVVEHVRVGDPFEEATNLGPLVSDVQRERVRGYIRRGQDEGAKLITGGAEAPEGLDRGYFVAPTVFSEVRPEMTIAQEEIFGPVLVLMPYSDEDEAVEIANGTVYGLAGGVWSSDPEHAQQVARRMRTGQVEINGATFNPLAPFGGYKQSGHGRELGRFGLEEFLEVKAIQQ